MAKIDEQYNKLQTDAIDLDLQNRLAQVKKNMRGLDSSTNKYNSLVKEVLELQIKRLENEKKKLKTASVQDKVEGQNKVSNLEKEINEQMISFTKYKLDTKANAGLKNKTNVTLKDLEKVFHDFIADVSSSISSTSKASINLSDKKLFRTAINSKRDKQEAYNMGITGDSESQSRRSIAGVEVDYLLDSEKDLAKSLKDAFVDIKETIESTSSKREFDIQSEKFKLLIDVLEKNRNVISDDLEKELEKLIGAVSGEVKNKSNFLSRAGGKYEDIKADAERLGITQKLTSAGNELAQKLGFLDSELGTFIEGIMSTIEGIDRFATAIFKIPETLGNFKKFISGSFSLLTGRGGEDQTEKLQEVKESIDALGEKFTNVVNEKTDKEDLLGDSPEQFTKLGKGLKGVNKLSKAQSDNLTKGNKLTRLSNSLMTGLNLQMTGLLKSFGFLRIKSFFTGLISVVTVFTTSLITATLAAFTFAKTLFAKTFIRGLRLFTSGIVGLGGIFVSLARFTLPLLLAGLGTAAVALKTILLPLIGLGIAVGLVVGGLYLMYQGMKKLIAWVDSIIPSKQTLTHNWLLNDDFYSGAERIGGWMNQINPFGGPSESEKQAQQMTNDVEQKSKPTPTKTVDGKNKILSGADGTEEFMNGLISAETGDITLNKEAFDESRFIRTGAGSDSSAYGPLQITKRLASGSVDNGVFDSDEELKKWVVEKYIPHGKKMLGSSYSDPKYGANGKGDLSGPEDRAMYEKMAKILVEQTLKDNKGNIISAAGEWRFGASEKDKLVLQDPRYAEKVLNVVNNKETKELQTVMDERARLAYNEKAILVANQAKIISQALPAASIINQNNNVSNGASSNPNTPVDVRNQCSTMVRSMDRDFCLQ